MLKTTQCEIEKNCVGEKLISNHTPLFLQLSHFFIFITLIASGFSFLRYFHFHIVWPYTLYLVSLLFLSSGFSIIQSYVNQFLANVFILSPPYYFSFFFLCPTHTQPWDKTSNYFLEKNFPLLIELLKYILSSVRPLAFLNCLCICSLFPYSYWSLQVSPTTWK